MRYQILTTGEKPANALRLWLRPGEPIALTRHVLLTLFIHRDGDDWLPEMEFVAPGAGAFRLVVPAEHLVDCAEWADLDVVPRAMEFDADGRPLRQLVEFVPRKGRRLQLVSDAQRSR